MLSFLIYQIFGLIWLTMKAPDYLALDFTSVDFEKHGVENKTHIPGFDINIYLFSI